MRKGLSVCCTAVIFLAVGVAVGCSTTAAAGTRHYKERISQFEEDNTHQYDVVFVGDSLTESGAWDEYFKEVRVANRGIWGDTTRGVLLRMNSILSTGAYKAFVLLGVNDLSLGVTPKEAAGRYERIVKYLAADGMEVYIQSTLPVFSSGRIQEQIDELNGYLREIAREVDQAEYIDVASSMSRDGYRFDGVHLNNRGYETWTGVIGRYVE